MDVKKISVPNEIMLGNVTELLKEGHTVVILANGYSMSPFIRHQRDSVELALLPEIGIGDIVLARTSPGNYVLHRLVARDGEHLTLKGDGNLDAVEHCLSSDICGTAIAIMRPGHKAVDCRSADFMKKSERWRSLPRPVRRYILAIYRRIKIL